MNRRRGIIIIVVLVVIVLLALAAYTFSQLMLSHYAAAQMSGRQAQARDLVASGVDSIRLYLALDKLAQADSGGHFDNPLYFQGVIVRDELDPQDRGRFTAIAPLVDGDGHLAGIRYGLENESARLNLNMVLLADQSDQEGNVGRTMLMALPGMTEDVADAILDWLDADEEPREFGAEREYYQMLKPAYSPKNGPLDTIEELLLVRGITPQALFGTDTNRNGVVDTHEMGPGGMGQLTIMSDAALPMDRGWAGYLTIYSAEANSDSLKQLKINLNDENLEQLHASLVELFDESWADFIIAYRQNGPYQMPDENEEGGDSLVLFGPPEELDLSRPAQHKISQILDLVGALVNSQPAEGGGGGGGGRPSEGAGDRPPSGGGGDAGPDGGAEGSGEIENVRGGARSGGDNREGDDTLRLISSPFSEEPAAMQEYLPQLFEYTTVSAEPVVAGQININEAPRAVLAAIPGMTETTLDTLVAQRAAQGPSTDSLRGCPAWPLVEGLITLEEMKEMMPYVCAGGDVHRTQIVGYFEGGGAFARAELIIDATQPLPRVLLWRDISHLGRGYPLPVLGVQY